MAVYFLSRNKIVHNAFIFFFIWQRVQATCCIIRATVKFCFFFKLINMLPLNLIIFSQREISSNVYLETCTSMSGVLITQRVYMICSVFIQIPSISLSSAIISFVLLLVLLLVHNKILLSTHSFTFIVIKQPIYFTDLFLNPYAVFPRSTL